MGTSLPRWHFPLTKILCVVVLIFCVYQFNFLKPKFWHQCTTIHYFPNRRQYSPKSVMLVLNSPKPLYPGAYFLATLNLFSTRLAEEEMPKKTK